MPTSDWTPQTERAFQNWYGMWSSRLGLHPNPDHPLHYYDWRAAYEAGATPNPGGHWPSAFKRAGHPRMVVDRINTKTGERVK